MIACPSVWALMVPTSLGYATLSGLPVQNGLYAAAPGLIVFALFTTSRQVTQGPGSSTAPVLGAAVVSLATAGSPEAVAAAVVLTAGLLFAVMAVLKLGWISQFLSAAVLTGFTFGVAINVAAGEPFKISGTDSMGSNTWQKLGNWLAGPGEANGTTVVVGVLAIVLLFGLKLLAPRLLRHRRVSNGSTETLNLPIEKQRRTPVRSPIGSRYCDDVIRLATHPSQHAQRPPV